MNLNRFSATLSVLLLTLSASILPAQQLGGRRADALRQNAKPTHANIEVIVGEQSIGKKPTANDETWKFRSHDFSEGVQYVWFEFQVEAGQRVRIISHRDGSDYSMFNAIQLVPIEAFE